MKVAMEVNATIALGTTNDNVLSTQQYMTAPFNCVLRLAEAGSATGLRRTLNVAGRSIMNRGYVNANNRVPQKPEDVVIEEVEVYQGQQIFLTVENPTAGALDYRARVELEEAVAV